MIKQLFKLTWNRKRANLLISIEIFISFLVLFAVVLMAGVYIYNYLQPLGFEYDNVLCVSVDTSARSHDAKSDAAERELFKQLQLSAQSLGEVESVALSNVDPFGNSQNVSGFERNGREIQYSLSRVTDSYKDVMRLQLVAGRWFSREDEGAKFQPVVISQRLAREGFGTENPIGKAIEKHKDGTELRVIGVFSDFRQDGELSPLENYAFFRQDEAKKDGFPLTIFLIRLRSGTPRAFEEKLITQFQSVAKEWSFEAQFLADMRESKMKMYLVPLAAAGSIVTFLMLMVALGLIGVLWQSVTRRTREIGVRRAFGATAGNVYLQILGELLAVTTVSLVAGTAVVGQLPLIDIFGFIQGKVFIYSLLASIGIMYVLTLICGLYPSWIATRVHPSQALHYD